MNQSRENYCVEFDLECPTPSMSPAELQALDQRNLATKCELANKFEKFRVDDPDFQVQSVETIFPVFIVVTTSAVAEKIRLEPEVKNVSIADDVSAAVQERPPT